MLTMGNAGMPLIDSIEIDEIHHPMLVHERRLITDGEGAGAFRGAPGARIEFGPLGCDMEIGYVSDGTINPAQGTRGGLPGAPTRQFKRTRDGELVPVPEVSAQFVLAEGESIVSYTAGGGGYGAPDKREPERVRHDVREGWISPERARAVYAVVIDANGEVDMVETLALRKASG